MRTTGAVIGIDIGTTSTKSVVFSRAGEQLGSAAVEYPLLQDRPGWAEQEPETILLAVADSVRGALRSSKLGADDIAALGISSAMHSLIAVDAVVKPLTRSITWADGRSEAEARRIRERHEGAAIYRLTGTPIHPMSPLAKLIWLRENQADIWEKAAKFVSIKEYVVYRLFGEWVVDYSIASTTGLLNLSALEWEAKALAVAGIEADRLSALRPGTFRLQGVADSNLAERMGLHPDTPLFLGGSDGALANLGVGAVGPGEMAVTIGTSGAVRMMTDRPNTDEAQRTFCYHVAGSSYIIGGATNNGGLTLQWMRESLFGGDSPMEELLDAAARVPAGAEGLLFLPYLTGERAPIYDSQARGTYFGATLGHGKAHFIRAGLEGATLAIASVANALRSLAGPANEIRASGGFARSQLWKRMLADMLGQEVLVPRVTEASALGAAVLALQGLGEIDDWRELKSWIPVAERIEPDARNSETYRELLALHEDLRTRLSEPFAAVAAFQRTHAARS